MKVLLVNPARKSQDVYIIPPVHLLYIAQAIRRTGNKAEIIDIPYLINTQPGKFNINDDSGIDYALSKEFDILGIGSVVSSYFYCERLVKKAKAARPDVPIIIGGSVGLPLKELWAEHAPVDYICESDGELLIERFMRCYPQDRSALKCIPGLYYLNEHGQYQGNKPDLPMCLDYIPFLTYDEVDMEFYTMSMKAMIKNMLSKEDYRFKDEERFFPIIFSRGCVYKCSFCFHFNHLHRKHSAEYIGNYIEFLKNNYGVSAFMILDDLTIIDKKWLHGVLDEIINRGIEVSFFSGGGKPGVVDRKILVKMKRAGFKRLSFGVESGSQKILDTMNKSTTVADNHEAISLIKEVGIPGNTNIVFGMPGETAQTMDETADFLISLGLNTKQYYAALAVPYPGSPLFDYCLAQGIIKDTRGYLLDIGGYSDYRHNLTDMPKDKFLAKVLDVSYRVDIAYYFKRGNYLKFMRFAFLRYFHMLYSSLIGGEVRAKIRSGLKAGKMKYARAQF